MPHTNPTEPHPEALAKSPQTSVAAADGAAAGCGQDKRESVAARKVRKRENKHQELSPTLTPGFPPLFSQL